MTKTPALLILATALAGSGLVHADESTFKAYGFMDTRFTYQSYEDQNFLRNYAIVVPDYQLYLDHVNTYFDWKPNSNIRLLAEVALNNDANRKTTPGLQAGFDSSAVYSSVFSQVGSKTRGQYLLLLQNTSPYSAYPTTILQHIADSLTNDTLSKTVHAIGEKVRLHAFLSNPTAATKDHGISLPRVHADILLTDELNLRVGKFITPAGIWNVDHGSPVILTVRQPYQTAFFPIFPVSQTGVQVFGRTTVADQDLSYAAWVTTGRGDADVLGSYDYGQDPRNMDDWAVGTHLQGDLGYLDGVRLGGSFHTGTLRQSQEWATVPVEGVDLNTQTTTTDLAKTTINTVDSSYSRELCYGLDSKVQWKGFLLQGEWNHRKLLNMLDGDKRSDFNGWYILLAKSIPIRQNLEVTPYAMYENIDWSNVENNPPLGLVGVPAKGFQMYVGGLNFGLFSCVRLKLEYSRVAITPKQFSSGQTANTFTDSDLAINEFDAQFSVAF